MSGESDKEYFNCIGSPSTDDAAGAYCLRGQSGSSPGAEKLLQLHWLPQSVLTDDEGLPETSTSGTGLKQFSAYLGTEITQLIEEDLATDYQYYADSSFSANWYQPKHAAYYLNQYRFEPGSSIKAWHWDGANWHESDTHTVGVSENGVALAAGAATALFAALAL